MRTSTVMALPLLCLLQGMVMEARAVSGASVNLQVAGSPGMRIDDPVEAAHALEGYGTLPNGRGYSWSVSGSADLAAGLVKGRAMASAFDRARFVSTIYDDIVISGPPLSTARVEVLLHVDGLGDLDDVGDSNRYFQLDTSLRSALVGTGTVEFSRYRHDWGLYTLGLGGSEVFTVRPEGDVTVVEAQKGVFEVVLRNALDVLILGNGQSRPLHVEWLLQGEAGATRFPGGGFASLDVAHTGRAGLVLPAGYSYTSASGVFLTSPVPEPRAYILVAAGVLLIVLRRRLGPA